MPLQFRDPPDDAAYRALIQAVHPPDWANPEPAGRYNLVVIGAGTAGLVTAAGAAGLGARVALVERHWMGGDCLNTGCVPSKSFIASAHARSRAADAARYGITLPPDPAQADFAAVMDRVRRTRTALSAVDSADRFQSLGVDVFFGDAEFTGPNAIQVGDIPLRFAKAVIATGARAAVPPIPGLAETGYLTNETLFNLTEQPARLLILGAGPIGCEMAQAFQRLGTRVTVIDQAPALLPREDPDVRALLFETFEREGIDVQLGTAVDRIDRTSSGDVTVTIRVSGEAQEVTGDAILVATGRQANTESLGLEVAGIACADRGRIQVNDFLQTTNRHVYAAGDCCMAYQFTHAAEAAAKIVIQNALFWGRKKASALTIPWCTYTDPEVAHVGLSETTAAKDGIAIDTYRIAMDVVDRAVTDGASEGFIKIHTARGKAQIMGATIAARGAGNLIVPIVVAMTHGLDMNALANTIYPYPTQAEAVKKAASAYLRTRLTPTVKTLFEKLLAFRR